MAAILKTVCVRRPIHEVFQYLTEPQKWAQWNPSTLKAVGSRVRCTEVGASIREYFQFGTSQDEVIWTVYRSRAPFFWMIEGAVKKLGYVTQKFTMKQMTSVTMVDREFIYNPPKNFFAPVDKLFVKQRLENQLEQAIEQFKFQMENEIVEMLPHAKLLQAL